MFRVAGAITESQRKARALTAVVMVRAPSRLGTTTASSSSNSLSATKRVNMSCSTPVRIREPAMR